MRCPLQSEFEAALTAILLRAVFRFLFAFKVFYTHLSEKYSDD
ncbi:hypothetical protein T12_3914 [Trichinella patagoniensis]|uniref:Uncharacterized protein n=1 Tax=Trichinella patagoniensis TaxID=990121 RepID=A0A0V0YYB8_9BILA|nr:hypothetical protein T12_3914 [Trichinella patagoniensis]